MHREGDTVETYILRELEDIRYDGDEAFLSGPTARTKMLLEKVRRITISCTFDFCVYLLDVLQLLKRLKCLQFVQSTCSILACEVSED